MTDACSRSASEAGHKIKRKGKMKTIAQSVKADRKIVAMTTSQIVWFVLNRHKVFLLTLSLVMSNLLWVLSLAPNVMK